MPSDSSPPRPGGTTGRVATARRGAVLIVVMNRPERANAIDEGMTRALDEAFNEFEDDPGLRVAVLTGGQRIFSAGTDLEHMAGSPTSRGGEYGIIRRMSPKPIIAAVEGAAFGGGFEIVLACDLVVASSAARFALPEVRRGLVASSGALVRLPWAMPPALATELLLTGRELGVEEARAWGLVNRVVEDGQALEGAAKLAEEIVANAPVAVSETLRAIRSTLRTSEGPGWQATTRAVEAVLASGERAEGLAAFRAGRDPEWRQA